eukprot:767660-Hanusia_phi.AAC.8
MARGCCRNPNQPGRPGIMCQVPSSQYRVQPSCLRWPGRSDPERGLCREAEPGRERGGECPVRGMKRVRELIKIPYTCFPEISP